MKELTDIRDRLIEVKNGAILELIVSIIEENIEFFEDLQIDQLEQGLDGSGNLITPKYRNPTYARVKQFMNSKPPFGTPDLKNTGSFHRLIKAKLLGNILEMDSGDSKTPDLLAKYGDVVLQLNEESIERAKEELLLPELLVKLPEYILS